MGDLRAQIPASLQPDDIAALSDGVIQTLPRRLAPHLTASTPAAVQGDRRLDFDGAPEHLGMKKGALYKLTSARTIPFHQDAPCFVRSELDEWRLNRAHSGARSRHLRTA